MIYDVAILGAGAAGLFLAANTRLKTIIIDHNKSIGKKISISGGGRANVTNQNLGVDRYKSGDKSFVASVLKRFDNKDFISWLKKRGCKNLASKKDQLFCPKSANELIEILRSNIDATLLLEAEIQKVEPGFKIYTSKGVVQARNLVVATGGLSYKKIGASGIGYEIARDFGHSVTKLAPALVGLTVQKEQFWFKELSGVSMRAHVHVANKTFYDDILFAHKGISGPAILNASLYWQKGVIEISFLKNIKHHLKIPHKIISSQLPFPKRFTKRFLQELGVEDKKVRDLSKSEMEKLKNFERYLFSPAGTFGYERAEVTRGGVALDGIDPQTMQSRLHQGLFFIGEVLDVTGELGGYNFQWAFSTAWVVKETIDEIFGDS